MTNIAQRLEIVRENIAAACDKSGRNPDDITLVVVTKTAGFEAVKEVIRLGCTDLGENRVQHLKQVSEDVADSLGGDLLSDKKKVRWHMIGHLQRNKVKQVLKIADIIHSVDTLRLAEEIDSAAHKKDVLPEVMLQVNCSGEPQKYGVPVGAAVHMAEQMHEMSSISFAGLMTMAPLTKDKDIVRACFVRAREIFEEIVTRLDRPAEFRHLSMGMSQDYQIAVEEGATILRIGSAIFA